MHLFAIQTCLPHDCFHVCMHTCVHTCTHYSCIFQSSIPVQILKVANQLHVIITNHDDESVIFSQLQSVVHIPNRTYQLEQQHLLIITQMWLMKLRMTSIGINFCNEAKIQLCYIISPVLVTLCEELLLLLCLLGFFCFFGSLWLYFTLTNFHCHDSIS